MAIRLQHFLFDLRYVLSIENYIVCYYNGNYAWAMRHVNRHGRMLVHGCIGGLTATATGMCMGTHKCTGNLVAM